MSLLQLEIKERKQGKSHTSRVVEEWFRSLNRFGKEKNGGKKIPTKNNKKRWNENLKRRFFQFENIK